MWAFKNLRTIRALPLAAVLLMAAARATAGDCWLSARENPVTGYGEATSAPRYARLRLTLQAAEAAQRADAAINRMPELRYRPHRYIGVPAHPGAPLAGESRVSLHRPEAWVGACGLQPWAENRAIASLSVRLNDLSALAGALADEAFPEGLQAFYAPAISGWRDGYPIYEGRVLLLSANGVPPLVPVSVGDYLAHWQRRLAAEREQARVDGEDLAEQQEWTAYVQQLEASDPQQAAELREALAEARRLAAGETAEPTDEWAELQRRRAALSPAEAAQPVYLDAAAVERYRFGYAAPDSPDARQLVRVNPALWHGTRDEQEVRLVALEVFLNRGEQFEAPLTAHHAAASAWLEQLDLAPYQALLGR